MKTTLAPRPSYAFTRDSIDSTELSSTTTMFSGTLSAPKSSSSVISRSGPSLIEVMMTVEVAAGRTLRGCGASGLWIGGANFQGRLPRPVSSKVRVQPVPVFPVVFPPPPVVVAVVPESPVWVRVFVVGWKPVNVVVDEVVDVQMSEMNHRQYPTPAGFLDTRKTRAALFWGSSKSSS